MSGSLSLLPSKRKRGLKQRRLHQEKQVRNLEVRYMSHRQPVVQSGKDSDSTDTSSGKPPCECYVCGKTDHLVKQCRQPKGESTQTDDKKPKKVKETITATTKSVRSTNMPDDSDPMNFLCSDFDTDGSINAVRIENQVSRLRKVKVELLEYRLLD